MRESSDLAEPSQGGIQMQWGVKIPLRDGIHLNATLYLPKNHISPSPAIFTLTPYIGQRFHDQGLHFSEHGVPFLAVDVRGRGNSEGEFRPLIQEAQDGFDVVEWLAEQPYCNGQVAMWGGSYGACAQWATAKEFPPHLATIVPVAAVYVGFDFPIRKNIASPYLMQWLTLVSGRTLQEKLFWGNERFWATRFREWFESGAPFKELDTLLGNPSAIFQEWIAHPQLDSYWDRFNPTTEQYAKLSLPILTITGIYDNAQSGALLHYRHHVENASAASRAEHFLVIGPWDHAGTRTPQREFAGLKFGEASLVDLDKLHLEWYAWTMQDGGKPEFLQKNVAYYVTGAERWRYSDTLEAITAQSKLLYLDSSGTASDIFASGVLREKAGEGPEDVYVYDPRDTRMAEFESASPDPHCLRPGFPTDNLIDQKPIFSGQRQQFIYHSAPFESDTEISGFFRLSAWLSIDQPDTDFQASVFEIDGGGGSILLSADTIRARYREGLREEKLISTTKPLRYDFHGFTFVSRLMRKGSRLRLVLGPINSIYVQKNYNRGGCVSAESMNDARTVVVKMFHNERHPTALAIPLGHPEDYS